MTTSSQLVEWKTNAWKDPGMVSWYSARMVENQGSNRLKNQIEVDLCLSHVTGDNVLDVGIGTGRGSLPLAARGQRVTGIDSSQAMLDECQRLARSQGLEIATRTAPLDRLPFADGSFDSLLSLNVLVHFPNWRQVLPEWTRVVGDGGRLVFDVHSLDHYRAAMGRQVSEEELLATDPGNYMLRVAAEDLVAEADLNGLAVVALVPYGAFLGGGNRNFLLGELETKHYWARLLSWLASDESMFEFALFLEKEWIAPLTTTVTGRFMAVLEKRSKADARQTNQENLAWLERNRTLEAGLHKAPIDWDVVSSRLPLDALRDKMAQHLDCSVHNRRLLELVGGGLVASGRLRWADLASAPWDAFFTDLLEKRQIDAAALAATVSAPRATPATLAALDVGGVSLAEGLEYFLMERILTRGFGRFTGVRS